MENKFKGSVIYTDDAISNMVGILVTSTAGVVGMASKSAGDVLSILQKGNYSKGVTITTHENNEVSIELNVIVAYGNNISTVCENIISNIKTTLEKTTELKIKEVKVIISDIKVID